MSGPFRQRRLLTDSIQCLHRQSSPSAASFNPAQRRTFLGGLFGGGGDKKKKQRSQSPFLNDLLTKKPATPPKELEKGDLSADSLFHDEEAKPTSPSPSSGEIPDDIPADKMTEVAGQKRNIDHMRVALDPNPRGRELWQRRKVIQSVRKRERLNKVQFLKRTERELSVKSHNFKTSTKKLGMLARQIQGKTVEEAIVQMRFSKKKVAAEIRRHLEFARDKATVARGMGLGGVIEGEEDQAPKQEAPIDIQKKDGKRYTVDDRSKMYVDQAWVGRGPYGTLYDPRARGQMNVLRTPWTHLTVKLKEEATLVREWKDREEKRLKQRKNNVWVPLPDRPIQGQNQYYTW